MKFYASVRMDVRRIGQVKDGDQIIGNKTKVKIVKNKVSAPFREVEFDLLYNLGLDKAGNLLDVAAERGVVEKSGAWYSYKGERLGQGRLAARNLIASNPELEAKVLKEVVAWQTKNSA